jgi:phospholipid N-methyltransferase
LRTLRNEALRQRLEILTLAKDMLEDLRRSFPQFQYSHVDYVKLNNFKQQLDRAIRQFEDKLQFETSQGVKA